jgi:hypothetical protein
MKAITTKMSDIIDDEDILALVKIANRSTFEISPEEVGSCVGFATLYTHRPQMLRTASRGACLTEMTLDEYHKFYALMYYLTEKKRTILNATDLEKYKLLEECYISCRSH